MAVRGTRPLDVNLERSYSEHLRANGLKDTPEAHREWSEVCAHRWGWIRLVPIRSEFGTEADYEAARRKFDAERTDIPW